MTAPATPAYDTAQLARVYVKIRDARAEKKKAFEAEDDELKGQMARIEGIMLQVLNTQNIESIKTEAGTFYKMEEMKPSCSDWSALYQFIRENDAFEALEKRITKKFVTEYMENHNGGLPPGVDIFREIVVRVRRS